jgi:hypothetical protein
MIEKETERALEHQGGREIPIDQLASHNALFTSFVGQSTLRNLQREN